jgi:pimeloyl-ACP methyl ester carboxylesterase
MADTTEHLSRWPGDDTRHTLPDGRHIQARHYGARGGLPVIMLHGTPGSRILFAGMHQPALIRGIHVIAVDRWAYGSSDAPTRPTLDGYPADIAALADQLNIARFAVAGVSGGGPYATACAVHLPARVLAAGLISPVGLVADATSQGEVDAFHRFCFHALPRAPRAVEGIFKAYEVAVRRSAGLACGMTTLRAPKADKSIIADCATSERLLAAFQVGLARSARGPAIDLQLFREIASLDLSRANMPARVWIGSLDRNVPITAAQRLARALPQADLIDLEGAGHLWVAHNYDVVLDWVLSAAREPSVTMTARVTAAGAALDAPL